MDCDETFRAFVFNLRVFLDGGDGGYQDNDCQLQDAGAEAATGCDGAHHNLDLYAKEVDKNLNCGKLAQTVSQLDTCALNLPRVVQLVMIRMMVVLDGQLMESVAATRGTWQETVALHVSAKEVSTLRGWATLTVWANFWQANLRRTAATGRRQRRAFLRPTRVLAQARTLFSMTPRQMSRAQHLR